MKVTHQFVLDCIVHKACHPLQCILVGFLPEYSFDEMAESVQSQNNHYHQIPQIYQTEDQVIGNYRNSIICTKGKKNHYIEKVAIWVIIVKSFVACVTKWRLRNIG